MIKNTLAFSFSLLLFTCCSQNHKNDESTCQVNPPGKLHYEFANEILVLHDISEYYFLSNLNTLTFHNGFYYNLEKDKKKIYQFRLTRRGSDTIEVFMISQMTLYSRPKDICFSDEDLYVLFEEPTSKLFKFTNSAKKEFLDTQNNSGELVAEYMTALPNSRIEISNGQYITGRFTREDLNFSNPDEKYFQRYDMLNKKVVSNFCNIDVIDQHNYFPSMEIPHCLNLDSFSFVSPGFKNTIDVFNIQTGLKKGSYCAKSEYINTVKGFDQDGKWDFQKQYNWLIENAYYLDLLFDENKKYFYRIAKHSQEVKNRETLRMNKIENAAWSIVVLDRALNYLDELNIPGKKLNFLKQFSDIDGIHFLSIDSLQNSQTDSILFFKKLIVL